MNAVMRFFDSFAAPLFGEDPEGRQVYFPSGAWGSGYTPKDSEAADKIRRRVRRNFLILFVFVIPVFTQIIPLNSPSDIPLLLGASASIGLIFHMLLRWYARGLPRSNTRMTLREANARHIKSLGRGGLIAGIILSLPLIGLGVAIVAIDEPGMTWLGWFMIAMFSACLAAFIVKLRSHARMAADNEMS
jgi:hypothetical protein